MNTVPVVYIVCAVLVLIWTQARFLQVSRSYRKQIKYYPAVAVTYSAYYLFLFVILISALALVSTNGIEFLGYAGLDKLKDSLKTSPDFIPPLLSAGLLYKAHDIRFFNHLDQFIVDRLLRAHNLDEDYKQLRALLENNDFTPSIAECTANFKMMEKFDVFISNPLEEPPDLHSGDPITLWRKVSTLIRFCEFCVEEDGDTRRKNQLAELREEHIRRTGVALHLLRLKLTTETLHGIDQQIEQAALLQQAPDPENRLALIVTSDELNRTTKLISQYFIADYKKLMAAVSELAAHLVIFSGASAGPRLKRLSEAGFKGLGCFRDLTFHKIILVLMSVFIGAFVLFYLFFSNSRVPDPGKLSNLALTTKIATVYAFSALCGALIGSSRQLMQKDETPWGWYLLAGLLGWFVWLAVTLLIDLNPDMTQMGKGFTGEIERFIASDSLRRGLPWSTLPFVFAMGIAVMSRYNPLRHLFNGLNERISDGIMMGLILVMGLWIAFMIHHGLETSFGTGALIRDDALNMALVIKSSALSFAFAFFIGTTVIVIARRVALSGLAIAPDDENYRV